ncbi:MAG TPA: TIGR03905 family TSCPD domain-containing protein [Eubacteriales bacterium]|nr:TIGR03905 family TSCPD domain-containing protein [Clostridia bacterium]HRV72555.1 TIGR03905 family TSCPD domain-containing protein [Eubacteriales bacterium]
MKHEYNMRGTCAVRVSFDLDDGLIHNVFFQGGCNGNLKAISTLIEGMPAERVVELLSGNTCGFKQTSCADQLARAVSLALKEA